MPQAVGPTALAVVVGDRPPALEDVLAIMLELFDYEDLVCTFREQLPDHARAVSRTFTIRPPSS